MSYPEKNQLEISLHMLHNMLNFCREQKEEYCYLKFKHEDIHTQVDIGSEPVNYDEYDNIFMLVYTEVIAAINFCNSNQINDCFIYQQNVGPCWRTDISRLEDREEDPIHSGKFEDITDYDYA